MRLPRLLAMAAVTALAATGLTGCGGDSTPPPDLGLLQRALVSGDFAKVPLVKGDTATTAAKQLKAIVAGLGDMRPTITVGDPIVTDTKARAAVHWSWPVAGKAWTYDTTVRLVDDGGWKVDWSPAIVQSDLQPGETLQRQGVAAKRGDILGAGGQALVTERPVVVYGIYKVKAGSESAAASSARELAQRLRIDADAYVKRVQAAAMSQFVPAITYREAQAPLSAASVDAIPGAAAMPSTAPLAPTREFAAPILGEVGPVTAEMVTKDPETYHAGMVAGLSGLQARYDDQLRGTPGTSIDRVDADGTTHELFSVPAVDGKPLQTTLDLRLQTLAEHLLAGVRPASALVALRPSTGRILAAANGPGNGGLNLATYGQMPPGSTFKTIGSLALLRAGRTPDSTVPCTPSLTVDGKRFTNDSDYPASGLGDVSLTTAIADSCNTAMISQRDTVSHDDLAGAAASLGFGVDHDTGFPAYFGQVPAPATETERAADMIGQGKVLASPMVMASVIGAIQRGVATVPTLIAGTDIKPAGDPISAQEHSQLREVFRAVVQRGTGAGLADIPGPPVIAKTGTAEFDRDGKRLVHAWMIAAQGDLAVAVYVDEGVTGAQTAGPIVEGFLRGAR